MTNLTIETNESGEVENLKKYPLCKSDEHMDKYALLSLASELPHKKELIFFDTKEELEKSLLMLSKSVTRLNQSFLYFSSVFPKGSLYPSSYEEFYKEDNKRRIEIRNVGGDGFFVQRTLPNGKIKSKNYMFREDFDWQLDEWAEKGCTDIYVLNERHSYSAEYYYDHDMLKKWRNSEPLFA